MEKLDSALVETQAKFILTRVIRRNLRHVNGGAPVEKVLAEECSTNSRCCEGSKSAKRSHSGLLR